MWSEKKSANTKAGQERDYGQEFIDNVIFNLAFQGTETKTTPTKSK